MQLHDNILNNLNNNCANLGLLVTIQDNNNHDNKLYLTNLDNDIISNNQIYCSGIVLNNINFNNFINRNNKAFVLNVKKKKK